MAEKEKAVEFTPEEAIRLLADLVRVMAAYTATVEPMTALARVLADTLETIEKTTKEQPHG